MRNIPFYWKLVAMLALTVLLAVLITSCARPQPMGEDIWLGVRKMKR